LADHKTGDKTGDKMFSLRHDVGYSDYNNFKKCREIILGTSSKPSQFLVNVDYKITKLSALEVSVPLGTELNNQELKDNLRSVPLGTDLDKQKCNDRGKAN